MFLCLSATIRRASTLVAAPRHIALLTHWRHRGAKEWPRSALAGDVPTERGPAGKGKARDKKKTHSTSGRGNKVSKKAQGRRAKGAEGKRRDKAQVENREADGMAGSNKTKGLTSSNYGSHKVNQENVSVEAQKSLEQSMIYTYNQTVQGMSTMDGDEDNFLEQMGLSKPIVRNKKSSHYQKQLALGTVKPLSFTSKIGGGIKEREVKEEEEEEEEEEGYLNKLGASRSAVQNPSNADTYLQQRQQGRFSTATKGKASPELLETLLPQTEHAQRTSSLNTNTKRHTKVQGEDEENDYLTRLTGGQAMSSGGRNPVCSPPFKITKTKDHVILKSDAEAGTDMDQLVNDDDIYFMSLMQKEAQEQQQQSHSHTGQTDAVIKSEAAGDDEAEEVSETKHTQTFGSTGDTAADREPNAASGIDALGRDQRRAVELALEGKNIFITGGAGSGKSLVIREIVRELREGKRRSVYITATTGVAALNVRGSTINSFSGVKFGDGSASELLKWVRRSRRSVARWKSCETLIIDEVSMMDPELFDKLDYIARAIRRKKELPFGGIQVILSGDFMQLPPIPPRKRWDTSQNQTQNPRDSSAEWGGDAEKKTVDEDHPRRMTYCFETDAWRDLGMTVVLLREMFRQKLDPAFQRILDEVRVGAFSGYTQEQLLAHTRHSTPTRNKRKGELRCARLDANNKSSGSDDTNGDDAKFVRLCATNKEVDARNSKHFAALDPIGLTAEPYDAAEEDSTRPHYTYTALDAFAENESAPNPPSWVKFEDSMFPTELSLKVGTRVMLLKNISMHFGLVNGSVGDVVGFLHPLELMDLVLRAPREMHVPSARGQALLERGGFPTVHDAFRCVDTAIGYSLFWSLRQRGIRRVHEVSYGAAYGRPHGAQVMRLAGLGEAEPMDMYMATVPPELLRRTRLPIVRLDTRPPLGKALTGKGLTGKELTGKELKGKGLKGKGLPRHVYACVSPTTHEWYMGDQVVATRTQIPLRHAWALTVHKAQGLTISHVEVSMHRFFSPGQAYVALSRCTELENMRLLNFKEGCIRTCPIAKEFYDALEQNQN